MWICARWPSSLGLSDLRAIREPRRIRKVLAEHGREERGQAYQTGRSPEPAGRYHRMAHDRPHARPRRVQLSAATMLLEDGDQGLKGDGSGRGYLHDEGWLKVWSDSSPNDYEFIRSMRAAIGQLVGSSLLPRKTGTHKSLQLWRSLRHVSAQAHCPKITVQLQGRYQPTPGKTQPAEERH